MYTVQPYSGNASLLGCASETEIIVLRHIQRDLVCSTSRARSVQLPYNSYYRSLKSAAVRCCYSKLGPFFYLCSSLLPIFIHPRFVSKENK